MIQHLTRRESIYHIASFLLWTAAIKEESTSEKGDVSESERGDNETYMKKHTETSFAQIQ
ncbi:MAG TPA: hypothetical protein VGO47_07160 [Chlamydiales bacterium]|nr:hypothetical protein [Chlamydiales bacterium]